MPFGDWQFWVVTVLALVAVIGIARTIAPRRRRPPRTSLTIDGAPPRRS